MKDKIKEVMASVFNIDASSINAETSSDDIEKWDSLNHMNLIAALEEEFDTEFEDEEMVELLSFRLIELTIEEKLAR